MNQVEGDEAESAALRMQDAVEKNNNNKKQTSKPFGLYHIAACAEFSVSSRHCTAAAKQNHPAAKHANPGVILTLNRDNSKSYPRRKV